SPVPCPARISRAAAFTSPPARIAAGRFPAPASHARSTSRTSVTKTSRNAIPCPICPVQTNRKIPARWSINWQTRWSHPHGNNPQQLVPCSRQTTLPIADEVATQEHRAKLGRGEGVLTHSIYHEAQSGVRQRRHTQQVSTIRGGQGRAGMT